MKKTMTTAFMTLAAFLGFSQETLPEARANLPIRDVLLPSIKEKVSAQRSFGYLRADVSDAELRTTDIEMLPGVGLGYRIVAGASAFDISASFNRRDTITAIGKERTYLYTLPKMNYFYYISAASDASLYAGGGMAWGGVTKAASATRAEERFMGLIPNIALGYEFNRTGTLRSFVQFDVSQPAIAAIKEGDLPRPFAGLSVGAGF